MSGAGFYGQNATNKYINDPPDSKYTTIAQPVPPVLLPLTTDDGTLQELVNAFNAVITSLEQTGAYVDAARISVERASGAALAGDTTWQATQLEAKSQYEDQFFTISDAQPAVLTSLVRTLRAEGFQSGTLTASDILNFQYDILAADSSALLIQTLTQLGADSATIDDIIQSIFELDIDSLTGDFFQKLENIAQTMACFKDPNKTVAGVCGCGVADTDSDGDGTPDCHDQCPNDPASTAPGTCGCGVADTDTDGDGTPDCHDQCPNDPAKTAPGTCGCGVADVDTDHDGTMDCLEAPLPPTIGSATAGNQQATVSFTPPPPRGSAITSYTVTSSPGGLTASGVASPITITGLSNGTSYTFTVTATNAIGTGAPSDASNSITPAASATIPDPPVIGTATGGNAQAAVSFTAPASNGGSAITSYTVTSSPGGLTASGVASPITITGLSNGTSYTFTVTATNAIGAGAPSDASNSITPAGSATIPDPPVIDTATAGNAQAAVSFTAPASNGGSAIASYTVTSSPGGLTASGVASPIP